MPLLIMMSPAGEPPLEPGEIPDLELPLTLTSPHAIAGTVSHPWGDTEPAVPLQVLDHQGEPVDLSTASTLQILVHRYAGDHNLVIARAAAAVDLEDGTVELEWDPDDELVLERDWVYGITLVLAWGEAEVSVPTRAVDKLTLAVS